MVDNENPGNFSFGQWSFNAGHWRRNFGQRGWLRPTVLRILEAGPKSGIEIMDNIQEMSHGWWRPSPGSLYPLLEQLASERVIKKNKDGRYEIADGYKSQRGPMNTTEEILTNMEGNLSYLEELSQANKKEFASYKDRLSKISQRLSKLK